MIRLKSQSPGWDGNVQSVIDTYKASETEVDAATGYAEAGVQANASLLGGAFIRPTGVSPRTSLPYRGAKQLEGKVQEKVVEEVSAGDILVASSKPSQRVTPKPDVWHYYTNPGHHVPNTPGYVRNKEVLPSNHEQLFEMSVPIYNKNKKEWERWAREGSGRDARYHRFQQHSENEFHWNGSSRGGVDSRGVERHLECEIPTKEIDNALEPSKRWGWWFW